ncbi:membrane dipeptidase [Fusarium albosuccineum]|uniref:Dipeptidase n=1 Tax=Fusarium albosuccineum TaxID=1237068 RepID=A0A8H4L8L6_9HYPO|nr:membrane dipeptidase [Fusarium albosuccineum]
MPDRPAAQVITPQQEDNTASNADPVASDTNERQGALILHSSSSATAWWTRFRNPIIAAGFALLLSPFAFLWPGQESIDPANYAERTKRILKTTPLIDGHNDLPFMLRLELKNRIYDDRFDFKNRLLGHTDLQRLRQGMVGGQFWSVYVDCDERQKHFEDPSWIVRDTLEQIDVTRRFIREHPNDLEFCGTAACARKAFKAGRIASMIGIEGGHQVGGSIASIRQMYEIGARYITVTHNCDNAFAMAASTVSAGSPDTGLSKLGRAAVKEMNRLGMMIDLAHVSHQTMRDVLSIARAPVIFSHSGAYGVTPHLRNVPDDVLRQVKHNGGIVMAVFLNRFLNIKHPEQATIHDVADHIFHIADVCGWECVGIGADFFGMSMVPVGLEDVSKYPSLMEVLMQRGATDEQIRLLAGENILRVWGNIEKRAKEIQATGEKPVEEEYEGRDWHKGLVGDPYMLRGGLEEAIANGAQDEVDVFSK